MTQGISDMLNLPTLQEVLKKHEPVKEEPTEEEEVEKTAVKAAAKLHDLTNRLALLEGTDHSEAMDDLHDEIIGHARDLMSYAFNADMRGARGIFEIAASLYGHAITTKDSKRDMQIKALKLALDKKKLELDERKVNHVIGSNNQVASIGAETGTVVVEDRNDLIQRLRAEINQPK